MLDYVYCSQGFHHRGPTYISSLLASGGVPVIVVLLMYHLERLKLARSEKWLTCDDDGVWLVRQCRFAEAWEVLLFKTDTSRLSHVALFDLIGPTRMSSKSKLGHWAAGFRNLFLHMTGSRVSFRRASSYLYWRLSVFCFQSWLVDLFAQVSVFQTCPWSKLESPL